jgi:hypothetical protein
LIRIHRETASVLLVRVGGWEAGVEEPALVLEPRYEVWVFPRKRSEDGSVPG